MMFWQESIFWLSLLLALSMPISLVGGLCILKARDAGIGWSFIRYSVLTLSIPLIGLLALNGLLSGEAAALIGGAMGYAFGNKDEKEGKKPDQVKGQRSGKET